MLNILYGLCVEFGRFGLYIKWLGSDEINVILDVKVNVLTKLITITSQWAGYINQSIKQSMN